MRDTSKKRQECWDLDELRLGLMRVKLELLGPGAQKALDLVDVRLKTLEMLQKAYKTEGLKMKTCEDVKKLDLIRKE